MMGIFVMKKLKVNNIVSLFSQVTIISQVPEEKGQSVKDQV